MQRSSLETVILPAGRYLTLLHLEEMGLTWFTQRTALDAIQAANGLENAYTARSPNNSIDRGSTSGGGAPSSARRASFMDMISQTQSPGGGARSPPPASEISPRKDPATAASSGAASSGGGGAPALQSKDAIYSEMRFQATTSCSYVAREMGLRGYSITTTATASEDCSLCLDHPPPLAMAGYPSLSCTTLTKGARC